VAPSLCFSSLRYLFFQIANEKIWLQLGQILIFDDYFALSHESNQAPFQNDGQHKDDG